MSFATFRSGAPTAGARGRRLDDRRRWGLPALVAWWRRRLPALGGPAAVTEGGFLMRRSRRFVAAVALLVGFGLAPLVGAQSQEPRPIPPGQEPTGTLVGTPEGGAVASSTPTSEPEPTRPVAGVADNAYTSPQWGYTLSWDPAIWAVEGEVSEAEQRYDGLQLGTPRSTLYLEGYAGFGGDAEACLRGAVSEVGRRQGVSDVEALPGRPTPLAPTEAPQQILLRYPQVFADGSSAEIIEFIACQELQPGVAVLETTFQAAASQYPNELPQATALLGTLTLSPGGA